MPSTRSVFVHTKAQDFIVPPKCYQLVNWRFARIYEAYDAPWTRALVQEAEEEYDDVFPLGLSFQSIIDVAISCFQSRLQVLQIHLLEIRTLLSLSLSLNIYVWLLRKFHRREKDKKVFVWLLNIVFFRVIVSEIMMLILWQLVIFAVIVND